MCYTMFAQPARECSILLAGSNNQTQTTVSQVSPSNVLVRRWRVTSVGGAWALFCHVWRCWFWSWFFQKMDHRLSPMVTSLFGYAKTPFPSSSLLPSCWSGVKTLTTLQEFINNCFGCGGEELLGWLSNTREGVRNQHIVVCGHTKSLMSPFFLLLPLTEGGLVEEDQRRGKKPTHCALNTRKHLTFFLLVLLTLMKEVDAGEVRQEESMGNDTNALRVLHERKTSHSYLLLLLLSYWQNKETTPRSRKTREAVWNQCSACAGTNAKSLMSRFFSFCYCHGTKEGNASSVTQEEKRGMKPSWIVCADTDGNTHVFLAAAIDEKEHDEPRFTPIAFDDLLEDCDETDKLTTYSWLQVDNGKDHRLKSLYVVDEEHPSFGINL